MFKKIINKVKDFFSKFRKPKVEEELITKTVESDEEYIRTKLIYTRHNSFMILLSYTPKYFYSVIEFIDACTRVKGINTKLVQSSYDEETDRVDEDWAKIIISHQKYHLLIGGPMISYRGIYDEIESLSNEALQAITKEIYANADIVYFKDLCSQNVLDKTQFVHTDGNLDIDGILTRINIATKTILHFTDIDTVMSRLPEGFVARDLVPFIVVNLKDHDAEVTTCSGDDYITMCATSTVYNRLEVLEPVFSKIIKEPTLDNIYRLQLAKYMRSNDEDDDFPGGMKDQEIDEIFKQEYERFNAISDSDNNIHYESIDEIITTDDEKVDILEESTDEEDSL